MYPEVWHQTSVSKRVGQAKSLLCVLGVHEYLLHLWPVESNSLHLQAVSGRFYVFQIAWWWGIVQRWALSVVIRGELIAYSQYEVRWNNTCYMLRHHWQPIRQHTQTCNPSVRRRTRLERLGGWERPKAVCEAWCRFWRIIRDWKCVEPDGEERIWAQDVGWPDSWFKGTCTSHIFEPQMFLWLLSDHLALTSRTEGARTLQEPGTVDTYKIVWFSGTRVTASALERLSFITSNQVQDRKWRDPASWPVEDGMRLKQSCCTVTMVMS